MFFKIAFFIIAFFILTGMKLMLKDGNFIEVKRYKIASQKVYFEKDNNRFIIPESIVDVASTKRLEEIEQKPLSVFGLRSTILTEKKGNFNEQFLKRKDKKDIAPKNDFKVKIETRKETNPFLMELPTMQDQSDDVVDKLKKKGVIFKIEVPLKK